MPMTIDRKRLISPQVGGWLAVFCSAICFYLATAIIRWAESSVTIATPFFVFARFFLGFIVVCLTLLLTGRRLQPRRYHLLLGRTLMNTIAVFCFYKAVEVGSLAEANILNMTYPLFVALFAWFFIREQRDAAVLLIVAVALLGIWLILAPGEIGVKWENLWGLSSGITASLAMIYLNLSRRHHDSQTILFYMFGLGALSIFMLFNETIFWPNGHELLFLFSCSALGVLGQYLLTYGFLFVTAVEGSIISSSRIIMAALLGPLLVGDPALTLSGWCGALLIFGANSVLAYRRSLA
ncbi:MAG: DMT family transporter [Gammaproteobacteria bacterium]|nr:DMT family transporter [Gammaproteobacteria bacterium]MCB1851599.1 DMT family transporter [Gammaproteobacteria bacterium]MCP5416029.1 DMT family transporter [Chromatiaceae bacterium]